MVRRVGLALLATSWVAVFLPGEAAPALAFALAVLAALLADPRALAATLRIGLLLALLFAAAVTAAVVAWAVGPSRGLTVGVQLLLRLLVLAIGATVLARAVDAEALLSLARRLRLERLGLVLGLALNVLPHLAVALRDVWTALRVRHRRRGMLRALPRLVEVVLAHTARLAEEAAAAASLRGHTALVESHRPLPAAVRVVVVTGARGSGKTTAVVEAAGALRERRPGVAGFAQPCTWEGGERTGFELVDLSTGERAALARRSDSDHGEHGTGYRFERAGFTLAEHALARARAGFVLMVDELGPVELRGRGHMSAVRRALATPGLAVAVIAVRRSLVPTLLAALALEDATVLDVEQHDDPAQAIVDAVLGSPRLPPGSGSGSGSGRGDPAVPEVTGSA